jgi:hypothetical protein
MNRHKNLWASIVLIQTGHMAAFQIIKGIEDMDSIQII